MTYFYLFQKASRIKIKYAQKFNIWTSVEEAKAACKEADDTFLPKLVAFRDDRKFLCANEVTWVDFYFFERL